MAPRRREPVAYGDVRIDVILDGETPLFGPCVVLLPSSARDSEDFDDFARRLAGSGMLVLRPQPRGMCGSTGPMEGLTLHDLARDVAAVIAQKAGGPAHVLGHAFGQWVARTLAADHPALVRSVILAAAAAKRIDPALREALAVCGDPARPRAERLAALRTAFFAPGHDPSPWLDNWHPRAGVAQRAATAQTDWWHGGTAPILDLQAALDPWRPPETAHALREELGADRVTVRRIENASHALIPEQPEAVARAVLDWIHSLTPERQPP